MFKLSVHKTKQKTVKTKFWCLIFYISSLTNHATIARRIVRLSENEPDISYLLYTSLITYGQNRKVVATTIVKDEKSNSKLRRETL